MMRRVPVIAAALAAAVCVFSPAFALAGGLSGAFPMTIIDDTGATVSIPRAPARIVSLAPSNTEILFKVGLGDRVVGVTSACDYPEAARRLPKVGDFNISIEAVVAARPDLVAAVADLQKPVIDKLRELGVCVLAVNPKTVEDVFRAMEMLGTAGGHGAYARMTVENLKARIRVVDRAVAKVDPADRPRVFVEIWNEPLMTAGSGTFIDDLVARAGARNIAADVPGWPQFSTETVLARAPMFIILTCFNKPEVMARREWRQAPAVLAGQVYEVHPDILVRPGPRLVEGLEVLAATFHPELFR